MICIALLMILAGVATVALAGVILSGYAFRCSGGVCAPEVSIMFRVRELSLSEINRDLASVVD